MLDYTIPNDAFTQELLRIRGLINQGQLRDAATALNQAQRAAPGDARVPLVGMRLASQAGHVEGAIQAARRALELAPAWPVALIELAQLLAKAKQSDEAMLHARHALSLEPDDVNVRTGAIDVAYQCVQRDQALEWLQAGLQRHPDHLGMRMFLGQLLVGLDRRAEAVPHFEHIAALAPDNTDALLGLLACALDSGQTEAARGYADRLRALSPNDDHVMYWHDVAYGNTPPTQPSSVVAGLFNDYADRFDSHLVSTLQYRVPERIAQILTTLHPDRRFNLLDLGCGTGLVGVHLGPIEGYIVGVDLSEKMLAQAARHGIYAKFHQVNVLDALRDTPDNIYEAITCADVLVYVGDLNPVLPNAWRIVKPGGHFIFSCEAADESEADLVFRPGSKRYAHKASAVERMCREAGFDDVRVEMLPALRMEADAPLPGFLVVARKPAA